ncbi:MAG: helix-turn-helix domain-containing protein [bacterium]
MPKNKCHTAVQIALNVIGGKWKPIILWHLIDGAVRFGELHRMIPGVSQKMLTQQLRELEADKIINRKVYQEVPPKVEYSLTNYGLTLHPILENLGNWGELHHTKQSLKTTN